MSLCVLTNRLFHESTFTPQVARTTPPRPFNPDDLERDRVLGQRIFLFGWVEEMHLDVPVAEGSEGFVNFAQQGTTPFPLFWTNNLRLAWSVTELLKMNHYKAPRDKLICILNCCKVIFGWTLLHSLPTRAQCIFSLRSDTTFEERRRS